MKTQEKNKIKITDSGYNLIEMWECKLNKKPYGFIDGPFIPQDPQSKKSEYIESV